MECNGHRKLYIISVLFPGSQLCLVSLCILLCQIHILVLNFCLALVVEESDTQLVEVLSFSAVQFFLSRSRLFNVRTPLSELVLWLLILGLFSHGRIISCPVAVVHHYLCTTLPASGFMLFVAPFSMIPFLNSFIRGCPQCHLVYPACGLHLSPLC